MSDDTTANPTPDGRAPAPDPAPLPGLEAYVAADDTATSSAAADAGAGAVDPLRPYSAEELAQLVAAFSTFGLEAEALGPYQLALVARARPGLELLGVGEALAEYGVGHGGGVSSMPAWARLLAGAAVVGLTVVTTRREFSSKAPEAPEGGA